VIGPFVPQVVPRTLMQVLIHDRSQLIESGLVSSTPLGKESGHIGTHGTSHFIGIVAANGQ
jgi:hypothetical protein